MPEYLAPGVYVEETSFRAKSIEGVSTSTTAFVGPARRGPPNELGELITSMGDFERIYGSLDSLNLGGQPVVNHLGHAVAAYFNNGGSRLYISRVFVAAGDDDDGIAAATANVINPAGATPATRFVARFPGSAGNGQVVATLVPVQATARTLATAPGGSIVRVIQDTTPVLFVKRGPTEWRDEDDAANAFPATLPTGLTEAKQPRTALLTLTLTATDADGNTATYEDLGFDPAHPRWLGNALSTTPSRRRDHLERLFAIENLDPVSPFALAGAIVDAETGSRVYALSG
ncbi:MAG: phage tail sheath family protein, partial [Gemmatimonadales bacterium]